MFSVVVAEECPSARCAVQRLLSTLFNDDRRQPRPARMLPLVLLTESIEVLQGQPEQPQRESFSEVNCR